VLAALLLQIEALAEDQEVILFFLPLLQQEVVAVVLLIHHQELAQVVVRVVEALEHRLVEHQEQAAQEHLDKATTAAQDQAQIPAAMEAAVAEVNLLLDQMVQMAQVATAAQVEQHPFPVLLRSTDREAAAVRVVARRELAAQMLAMDQLLA
jgi:hypothetical protein